MHRYEWHAPLAWVVAPWKEGAHYHNTAWKEGTRRRNKTKKKKKKQRGLTQASLALPVTCTSRVCLPASRSGSYLHSADEAATVALVFLPPHRCTAIVSFFLRVPATRPANSRWRVPNWKEVDSTCSLLAHGNQEEVVVDGNWGLIVRIVRQNGILGFLYIVLVRF